uniref:26S proteasome non-ATPase regulatory subunit 2-like isoform X1 n=2 Tax=Ciona intestinalis TaxID=7719 RepID=UPI0002B8D07B|nr:26S proteasome non-ATPase regulatory subunit 2-like isoform X1 [Ciona intestinalis]|eukprot:XP_002120594.2 26S proteasome non-ATPase regulatory subunit 2-like isoform X1 [Ciona intestinalis]
MPPTSEAKPESVKEDVAKKEKKTKEEEEPELSEEDKQLLDELNLCIERLKESDATLYKSALEILRTKIRSSTASITSVPKPLKFLRPHYGTLKEIYERIPMSENKKFCADIVSVLGMTISDERECLKYRLLGSQEDIGSWGHEYVRHISGEVASEWQDIDQEEEGSKDKLAQLLAIVKDVIPYDMKHNAETEACDLLMEIEKLDMLLNFVDKTTYARVCLYLVSCVPYAAEPENTNLLQTAVQVFRKFDCLPEALRLAMQLNDMELIVEIFLSCKDQAIQKQLAFALGRQQVYLELDEEMDEADDMTEILSNSHLNSNFLSLARELDIMEPKVPEDIYKTHLENSRPGMGPSGSNVDSARMNLASSYVNGFVNAAFGQDKLLTEEGNKWIYKNKEHGMLAATASLGLVLLWDVDGGLTQIDKYLYSSEDYIKSGALLACGIVNTGVRNECDPALALLSDYVLHNSNVMRIGSVLGLGLAYAGSNRMDLISLLTPVMADSKSNMEVIGITALALGLISVGTCNGEVTSALLQTLIERSESELKETHARFIALALALVYLGKQEAVDTILMALQVVPEPLKGFASVLVEVCAYAGTGNVLKVQQMLHICTETDKEEEATDKTEKSEKSEKKKDSSTSSSTPSSDSKKKEESKSKSDDKKTKSSEWGMTRHAAAVLGIGLISAGEEIGSEMAFRMFGHLYRYGDLAVRRTVPLALALTSVSNPQLHILDTLSKFSHDSDAEVVHNSIFGMALVGSGTNNARLAQMLRNLAVYYSKDPNNLFLVRLVQGLVHLGKGTLTLQPYHSDRQLLSPVAMAALLSVIVSFLDVKNTILSKSHYLLYTLVPAIQPRMLVTFNEDLNPLTVSVRVGQAVDVVGQAGKPKTITGFQTHTTPVLLAYGERAELATEEYIALTPVIEGFVILRKNPDYE